MNKIIITSLIALALVLGGASSVSAIESKVLLIPTHSDETLKTNEAHTILWSTENFPVDGLVNINLIKKTSDSPAEYEFVREILTNIPNSGSATWTPSRSDIGNDLMIEIGCSTATDYPNGCVSGVDQETFAVRGTFSDNLASAFDAFIAFIKGIFGR
jgi:hypothetical protein